MQSSRRLATSGRDHMGEGEGLGAPPTPPPPPPSYEALCKLYLPVYEEFLSQNGLSAIFDIFKVRAPSYNTK